MGLGSDRGQSQCCADAESNQSPVRKAVVGAIDPDDSVVRKIDALSIHEHAEPVSRHGAYSALEFLPLVVGDRHLLTILHARSNVLGVRLSQCGRRSEENCERGGANADHPGHPCLLRNGR
jgi:hypothetical protein